MKMTHVQNLSFLMQCHLETVDFNYDVAVDWAIDLMMQGIETENVLILSSFSKPVNAFEIRSYVRAGS